MALSRGSHWAIACPFQADWACRHGARTSVAAMLSAETSVGCTGVSAVSAALCSLPRHLAPALACSPPRAARLRRAARAMQPVAAAMVLQVHSSSVTLTSHGLIHQTASKTKQALAVNPVVHDGREADASYAHTSAGACTVRGGWRTTAGAACQPLTSNQACAVRHAAARLRRGRPQRLCRPPSATPRTGGLRWSDGAWPS